MLWVILLLAHALAACPTTGTVYFAIENDGCHPSHGAGGEPARPIAMEIEFGRCYPADYRCGGDPSCSNGNDWESIFTCGPCEPSESFMIQDGALLVYTQTTDCTGREYRTNGCLYDVITAGGLKQFDAVDAVEASACPVNV